MKAAMSVLCILLMLGSVGCGSSRPQIVNLPPGVDEVQVGNWYVASGALRDISGTVEDATAFVISLNRAGVLPDGPKYAGVLRAFGKMAVAGGHAVNILKEEPRLFGASQTVRLQQYIDTLLSEFDSVLEQGDLVSMDAAKADTWRTYIRTLRIAITTVVNLVNAFRSANSIVLPTMLMEVHYV